MRTINGKSFEDIMTALKQPFENHSVDFDNNATIPYELVKERANSVLGLNYSVDMDIQHREIEGEQHITCVCKISIFDDLGSLVAQRSHARADFHERFKKDHYLNPGKLLTKGDEFSSMASLAYKKAFTMFGLGDQFAIENANKSANHKSKTNGSGRQSEAENANKKVKAFLTLVNKQTDQTGEQYAFQNSEGKMISFTVTDRSKVENYKDLGMLPVGGSICLYFFAQSRELFGVTMEDN